MSDADNWLERFKRSYDGLENPSVYWLAVATLVTGTVAILWSLPVPIQFYDISPLLNWGSAFLMAAAIYYFVISLSLAIGLLPILLALAAAQIWLQNLLASPVAFGAGLAAAGIAGLSFGRRGKLAAIVEDVQLMMIAPAWLLSVAYQRLRIPI